MQRFHVRRGRRLGIVLCAIAFLQIINAATTSNPADVNVVKEDAPSVVDIEMESSVIGNADSNNDSENDGIDEEHDEDDDDDDDDGEDDEEDDEDDDAEDSHDNHSDGIHNNDTTEEEATQVPQTKHQELIAATETDFDDIDFSDDAEDVALEVLQAIAAPLYNRMEEMFDNTETPQCRELIAQHFGHYINAIGMETPLPFTDVKFQNECEDYEDYDFDNLPKGVHLGMIQNRTYRPPRNETEYISPEEVVLCYGILAHDSAEATIQFIEAVEEPTTIIVVHVDAKYEETHQQLLEYAKAKSSSTATSDGDARIHILDDEYRVRVNWGGFSMVNATMQMLRYADRFDFTHFVHMASSAYPVASNRRIRNRIASFPKDANFMHVILKPSRPAHQVWHYFVECDDRVHRIYRLPPLQKTTHGIELHTSSQWFIISKDFAHYLANPVPGSFLFDYLDYAKHVVVADETFFGTVLRHTPFCHKHHNWHFLHLQFDQWENEREVHKRDERKCIMPDPNHCGRSPTIMTTDYLDILELSGDLYARKFSDEVDAAIKHRIDGLRQREEGVLTAANITDPEHEMNQKVHLLLEGHGSLFVAKDTVRDAMPLCLGLGPQRNRVRLVPCFHEHVPPTLATDWETGAVVLDETLPQNRWEIAPCSSDGGLERLENGVVNVTAGEYSPTGPRCMIRMMDGLRVGRCMDGESLDSQPGGAVHVFPCTSRWGQYLSFGDGVHAPKMSLHTNVPLHTIRRIAETDRTQEPYMCLGVAGRGDGDEEDWLQKRSNQDREDFVSDAEEETNGNLPPLSKWVGKHLIATKCSNVDAIIEWALVPFIVEEAKTNTASGDNVDETVGTPSDPDAVIDIPDL